MPDTTALVVARANPDLNTVTRRRRSPPADPLL